MKLIKTPNQFLTRKIEIMNNEDLEDLKEIEEAKKENQNNIPFEKV